MKSLLFFLKKLQDVTGFKMYLNILFTILISALEGIGIYLLVPMLAIIGLVNLEIDNIFPISLLVEWLKLLPFQLNLTSILIIYFLLITGQGLLQRSQSILNTDIQQTFIRTLRMETYESLIHAKWKFFLNKRKSDFNYILTTEISRVGIGTHSIIQLTSILFFTLVQVILAFLLSPLLTSVVLVCGIVLGLMMRKFVTGSKRLGNETSGLMNDYFGGITEQYNGVKDMKSNMLEGSYYQWFESLSGRIYNNVMKLVKLSATSKFLHRITSAILIIMFVYTALNFMKIQTEQMLIVILIFSRLWPKFSAIQSSLEQIGSMFPAFKNVISIQNDSKVNREIDGDMIKRIAIDYSIHEARTMFLSEMIECRNVSFRYNNEKEQWALSNVDIQIPVNSTTAIVGQSGAGKSTLVDIIMGLLQPELGQVLAGGTPLTDKNLLLYRSSISYVSQDPYLFHTTVRENLLLVKSDATDSELWEALQFAAADIFVKHLPEGLDTVIGDRGVKLSGGERQRLVLARAILRKPSILVLDEATSALDSENERKIQHAIDRLKGKMTIIVIAHRLSTIRNSDQVIVLNEGKVIQQGPYQHVSETRGAFRKMLISQELAGNQTLA